MDPFLIGNFIYYPNAKVIWDAISTAYFGVVDTSQLYDLWQRVIKMRQVGRLIEKYYNNL